MTILPTVEGPMMAPANGFEYALMCMRRGYRVCRSGWNGTGMWIAIQNPDENSMMGLPYIYMKTSEKTEGKLVPWLASQTDLLAKDWQVAV